MRGGPRDREGEKETGGGYVKQFGFSCDTCCGLLPMPNEWRDDWVVSVYVVMCTRKHSIRLCVFDQEFFCQMRLGKQMELVESRVRRTLCIYAHNVVSGYTVW